MTSFGEGPSNTLGVEEEFMIVDPDTGALRNHVHEVLAVGEGPTDHLQHEIYQSVLETATAVCQDLDEVREEVVRLRSTVIDHAREEGAAIAAAGAHPFARWEDQKLTPKERYQDLVERHRWVAKRELVFGQHVHASVGSPGEAIYVTNWIRPFLPILLALSANSPFWRGEPTGLKSTRVRIFDALPRTGIPRVFDDWDDWMAAIDRLRQAGSIDDVTKMWYDVRPRHDLGTVEVRMADLPTTVEESVALAGLTQALVARLARAYREGEDPPLHHDVEVIRENRWRALRDGLEATFIQRNGEGDIEPVPMRRVLDSTLHILGDVPAELGVEDAMDTVADVLNGGRTGADRQMEVLERQGDLQAVVDDLVARTAP